VIRDLRTLNCVLCGRPTQRLFGRTICDSCKSRREPVLIRSPRVLCEDDSVQLALEEIAFGTSCFRAPMPLFYTLSTTMPYVFDFQGPEANFRCDLTCEQCTAHSASGARCKRVVCIGLPYCWQHSRSVSHVTIKDGVHGKGLFAWAPGGGHARVFRTGDPLVVYGGEHLATAQIEQRYGLHTTAPYALQLTQNHIVDAACKRGIGSIANAPRGTSKKTNAKYAMNNVTGIMMLRATRPIYGGQEIVVGYGGGYWAGHKGAHMTRRR
jgi:hypothetical protein